MLNVLEFFVLRLIMNVGWLGLSSKKLSASLDTRLRFEPVCVLCFCSFFFFFFFNAFWQNAVTVHVLFNEQ